jgi:hypothetical protein
MNNIFSKSLNRMMGKNYRFLIAAILLLSSLNYAQVEKKAQTGFRFLENPVSAEVVGRGTIGVINTFNSNAIFWNPSLLAFTETDYDISVNHTRGVADINYNAVAASINILDFGVLGFSLLAMDYGTFYSTVRLGESGYMDMGTFSPTSIAIGTAFSQRISDHFSYGVHIKYARQNLGEAFVIPRGDSVLSRREYELDVFALDVGAYYDFLVNGIKFGATLQNISRELRYEVQQFPLPFAVSFGASINPLELFYGKDPMHSFTLSFESRHPRDFGEKVKLGAEYQFSDFFIARAGYVSNYDERDWTAGVGFKQHFSEFPIRVDYAYQPFGILGDVHFISLGVGY